MPMTQTRRRFLTTLSLAGAAGLVRAPPAAGRGGAARNDHRPPCQDLDGICIAPQYVAEELLRAGGLHRYPLCRCAASAGCHRGDRARRGRFQCNFCAATRRRDRRRRADHGPGRRACRLLRIVRERKHPQHRRSERQDRRGAGAGVEPPSVRVRHGGPCRARPRQRHPLGHQPIAKPLELFADGKIDAFLGFRRSRRICAPATSVTWSSTAPWTARGRNISAACWRATATSSANIRSRPSACCAPSSRPTDLCATEPARVARRLVDGGFTDRYDYALQTLSELPYDKWREFDRRGHDAVLCAAVARSGHDQIDPAEDHRRRHRLALPERAQTRAEGVSGRAGKGRLQMPMTQTRRRFLSALAAAGAAGLLGTPRALAGEGPPETTTIRLPRSRHLHRARLRRRGAAARRRLHRYPLRARRRAPNARDDGARRDRLQLNFAAAVISRRRRRRADHDRWPACMPAASSCSRTSASAASRI